MLGSAESDDPLLLPLEAIELDAFRRRHAEDTFWCGLLLGGCGERLTTKLYTDRVCHFSHLPDPTGLHVCERRARDVSSADHLYAKSAATAWLRDQGHPGTVYLREPLGSVVDITFEHQARGLRLHLDDAVAPVWDDDVVEPVLGVSVPVDDETLVRRWYVHRIRLESRGTARDVRIGTEAFARPTQWFTLQECSITERGLSTPAVEQITAARRAPRSGRTGSRPAVETPNPAPRAKALLRRLADGRKLESVVIVTGVVEEIRSLGPLDPLTRAQVDQALQDIDQWFATQAQARRDLFARLDHAVREQDSDRVHQLLLLANARASHERTASEETTAAAAAEHLAAVAARARAVPRPALPGEVVFARQRVEKLLANLEGRRTMMTAEMCGLVDRLVREAATAGDALSPGHQALIQRWVSRAEASNNQAAARETQYRLVNGAWTAKEKVSRRLWIARPCSRCGAQSGQDCRRDHPRGPGQRYLRPHDERLQPILDERKARERQGTCPICGRPPGEACATLNGGPHSERIARKNTATS
ncbi:zinc finger domain-containing protein [Kitasatospora sp. NPDC001175]|uniref:zinc finger domain-containing protein n=1 Tax=Kitasatospora sp. NPDC001175 TaxID=3157103 RepID=UPI003CFCAA00